MDKAFFRTRSFIFFATYPLVSFALRIVSGMSSARTVFPLPPRGGNGVPVQLQKPNCSYNCLVGMALMASNTGRLPVNAIYQFLERTFPYFKYSAPKGWKNSIRHSLSLSNCFRKIPKLNENGWVSKKGNNWEIDPFKQETLEKEIQQFLNEYLPTQQQTQEELSAGSFNLSEQLLQPPTSSVGPSFVLTAGQKLTYAQLQMIISQLPPQLLSVGRQLHITVQQQQQKKDSEEGEHSTSSSHQQTSSIDQFPCDLQDTDQRDLFKCQSGFDLDDYAMDIDDVHTVSQCDSDRGTPSTFATVDAAVVGSNLCATKPPISGTTLESSLVGDLTLLLESVNAAIEREYGYRRRHETTLGEVIAAINAVESREPHPVYVHTVAGVTCHGEPESGGVVLGGIAHGPLFSVREQKLLLRELKQESRSLNMDLFSYINSAIKNVF